MTKKSSTGSNEFILLMAVAMSMVALSIDAMLPALALMAFDLGVADENDRQLVITMVFLGLAAGQLIYGPVSDSVGRKAPMMVGLVLFAGGSLISVVAQNFTVMLFGRFLQGLGAAGPRTLSVAMIRDRSAGSEMARIMSLVMMVFILVPALAPGVGQLILLVAHWRMIFWLFVGLALFTLVWLGLRQPETLRRCDRSRLSWRGMYTAFVRAVGTRQTQVYTLAGGLVFGAFVGYLNSSQQILQERYALGDRFALYFAVLAFAIGFSSYFNSRLVGRFGLRFLCLCALTTMSGLSLGFLLYCWVQPPPLWGFMAYMLVCFFAIGILFSNFNALAMEPLGEIAGMAASLIGSVTTLLALGLGYVIGQLYNHSVIPLVGAFAVLSAGSLLLIVCTGGVAQRQVQGISPG